MFEKKIKILSREVKNLKNIEKASSYIGKSVYSKSGTLIGRVYDVALKNDIMQGIFVLSKLNKLNRLFIGKEFFRSESKKGIVLKIEPVTSLIGKKVYDAEGRKIGKVIELKRKSNSNNYTDIIVKKSLIGKPIIIPKKHIDLAKKSIILKIKIKEKNEK